MVLNGLLFVSAFLLAIMLGVSFSHLMQRPTKARLTPGAFLQVQQVLISRYGRDLGQVEVGAVLMLGVALTFVWNDLLQTVLIGFALASVVAMLLVWAIWLNPINKQVNTWTPTTLPEGWERIRTRWANLHLIRLFLALIGFGSLLVVLLLA